MPVALATITAAPLLYPGTEYVYGPGAPRPNSSFSHSCNSKGLIGVYPFCGYNGAYFKTNSAGTGFNNWIFASTATSGQCKRNGDYLAIKSAHNPRITVSSLGSMNYSIRSGSARFVLSASVQNGGQSIEGWFSMKWTQKGSQCSGGKIKFFAYIGY